MNPSTANILTRYSVREFTGQRIPKDTILEIIRAGMAAPSAVDKRPWEFIAITEPAQLRALTDTLPFAKMTAQAGTALVVAGRLDSQWGGPDSTYWVADCSAATQNILLAAHALGLGAVWTAVYPEEDRIKTVRDILDLPQGIIPLNILPIGYPKSQGQAKDKWQEEKIHWNRW